MNTKLATAQIRVKNWAAIIQERNESGLSVKDYCAQHRKRSIASTCSSTPFSAIIVSHYTESKKLSTQLF